MPILNNSRTQQGPWAAEPAAYTQDQVRGIFGQVMGLVAVTLGCLALGAWITRHSAGGTGILFFLVGFACIFGVQFAAARGREQLAVGLLFGLGLCLGMAVGPVINYYAHANPGALYQAAGSTGLFTAGLGAYGYASRRDFSVYYRALFWALIGLIVVGLITLFVAIPGGNVIYCVLGLVVFGAFTVFDFNRLRRVNSMAAAPVIAVSIFLDIFNVFLLFLSLFGGGGSRR